MFAPHSGKTEGDAARGLAELELTAVIKNHGSDDDSAGEDHHHGRRRRFPMGYRFCPTDDELIVHYLRKKVLGQPLSMDMILEVNLYKYDPDTVSGKYEGTGEGEWYFFTPRDRKYPNGDRPNRAAGNGYWKATGADRKIKVRNVVVGLRKALVYYVGKPPNGVKSNWIMHEYRLVNCTAARTKRTNKSNMRLDDYVLCRIYRKSERPRHPRFAGNKEEEAEQYSSPSRSSLVNPIPQTPSFHHQTAPTAVNAPGEHHPNDVVDPCSYPAPGEHYPNEVVYPCTYPHPQPVMNNYMPGFFGMNEDFGRDWRVDFDMLGRYFSGGGESVPLPVDDNMDYGLLGPDSFNL